MTRALLTVLLALTALPALAQERFQTPEAAVDALAEAAAANDRPRIQRLFGPEYVAFAEGQREADPAMAESRAQRFAAALKEFRFLAVDAKDRRTLIVGAQGWPFPIPIVRSGGRWQFDGKEGVEELLNRLIGANELNAISVLDYYGIAQREYAERDLDGDGIAEYARRLASTPGQHDGLYWEDEPDQSEDERSPLGPLIAFAEAKAGERKAGDPFLGYRYRILEGQGASAKAGAYEYVINGHMLAGFAAIAWPAGYGDTGIMTFVVNQDGVIYQRDLGRDTEAAAAAITKFDPGSGWTPVDDDNLFGEAVAAQ